MYEKFGQVGDSSRDNCRVNRPEKAEFSDSAYEPFNFNEGMLSHMRLWNVVFIFKPHAAAVLHGEIAIWDCLH